MEDIGSMEDAQAPGAVPRPIITKMVLENFKSYAGVKEIGPFHKVLLYRTRRVKVAA